MKYKYVVWDFNGTILDDVQAGIDCVNPILEKRGLKVLDSVDEYREKFDFPIINYYRNLGFDFERDPYEVIAHEWIANYKRLSPKLGLVDGVGKLFDLFEKLGAKQMILSASEKVMLENKLNDLGIYEKFTRLLALDNIYAHSKLDIAKEYFKDTNTSEYIMIGDTVHDAEVAREVGIDAWLVAGGHHGRKNLEETGFPVFGSMHELTEYIINFLQ